MGMYCLIIEYGFVSMSGSFNNRVMNKSDFVEPSPSELRGTLICLQPYPVLYQTVRFSPRASV
jgi:hypothetical protein